MAGKLSGRRRGGIAIILMWIGFVVMYVGISGGIVGLNVAGLAVAGAGTLLVLLP